MSIEKFYQPLPLAEVNALLPAEPPLLGDSQTGTAGGALTVTIPAPGAGLYVYVLNVEIDKVCSAALLVAVGLVNVTSTNLRGMAWTFGLPVLSLGTEQKCRSDFGNGGIQSTLANTAVTIVCPAQANTQWRVRVTYMVGP